MIPVLAIGIGVMAGGICLAILAGSLFTASKRDSVVIASGSIPPASPDTESPIPELLLATPSVVPVELIAKTEPAGENHKPIEIVFPSKREFRHPFKVVSNNVDDGLKTYCVFPDDKASGTIGFFIFIHNPSHDRKDLKLKDAVQIRFSFDDENWDVYDAEAAIISIDDNRINIECKREGKYAFAWIDLSDFKKNAFSATN